MPNYLRRIRQHRHYFRQVHQSIAGIRADVMAHHPDLCTQETA
ncbi:MAG: hypothetical protein ACK5C8_10065 [Roseiflexaceae bacterium]